MAWTFWQREERQQSADDVDGDGPPMKAAVRRLRRRATDLRRTAFLNVVLAFITVMLGVGVYVALGKGNHGVVELGNQVVKGRLDAFNKSMVEAAATVAVLQAQLVDLRSRQLAPMVEADVLGARFSAIEKTVAELRDQVGGVSHNAGNLGSVVNISTDDQFYNVLLVTLVRVTTLVLLLGLFLFFTSSFRYYTRLAYFYDSRADTLLAFPDAKVKDLSLMMAALEPQFDFKQADPTALLAAARGGGSTGDE